MSLIYGYKRCPRCEKEVRDFVERCDCGWKFYKKECPRCGKIVPDSAKVCYDCLWYFYWETEIGEDDELYCENYYDDYYEDYYDEHEDYDDYFEEWY